MERLLATCGGRLPLEQHLNDNIILHGNCLNSYLNKANAMFPCPASKGNRPMAALFPPSPRGTTKAEASGSMAKSS
jgi:hypothetical protein